MKPEIRIGTSGWNYPHWKGLFYPTDHQKTKWLEFYSLGFNTVEVNATFYRLPQKKTFRDWRLRTPDHFLWAVKGNRYITHIKRLCKVEEGLERFYDAVSVLGDKLGPILFQLPPSLSFDEELFKRSCLSLKPEHRHALEVRHPSWIDGRFFHMLDENNIAFCISDTAGRYPYSEAITSDFIYIRLHGSKKLYASEYSAMELNAWAEKICNWNRDTFVYFDNDFEAYAVRNAARLKEILSR